MTRSESDGVGSDAASGRRGESAELERLRARIDRLDEQLVELLSQRAACALEIGTIKSGQGLKVYQPDREQEVITHVQDINCGPLDAASMIRLFERIIDETRRLERGAMQRATEHAQGKRGE